VSQSQCGDASSSLGSNLFNFSAYKVLATVSSCYSFPKGRFLRVTHPSATKYYNSRIIIFVQLACVKHTASVHPEPESNSP